MKNNNATGNRVAIMGENSYQFVVAFFASLTLANTFAVPLCTKHTEAEIRYQLEDSGASLIVTPERFLSKVSNFNQQKLVIDEFKLDENAPSDYDVDTTSGYMLYTSGTSGNPKGVVTPLDTFMAQAKALTQAWDINSDTIMLQTLPLHHIHGLLIGTTLPLLAGGRVEYLFPFDPSLMVNRLSDSSLPPINTYTAVPTIYTRLVSYINGLPEDKAGIAKAGIKNLKLAMCGSAALPQPLRDSWEKVTDGKVHLLERYGMTETGITFSQPLDSSKRVAGSIGSPVPSVLARLETDNHEFFTSESEGVTKVTGEIQLSGPVVFKEYWNKPDKTEETFTKDGWFKTGDVARIDDHGNWFILGRASMDIIKSGGEKISALEIEREILGLPQVSECAVVGVDSEEWGQEVSVVAVLSEIGIKENFGLPELKTALKKVLAGWKIPKRLKVVEVIPRNQMGKVNKKTLVKVFSE